MHTSPVGREVSPDGAVAEILDHLPYLEADDVVLRRFAFQRESWAGPGKYVPLRVRVDQTLGANRVDDHRLFG